MRGFLEKLEELLVVNWKRSYRLRVGTGFLVRFDNRALGYAQVVWPADGGTASGGHQQRRAEVIVLTLGAQSLLEAARKFRHAARASGTGDRCERQRRVTLYVKRCSGAGQSRRSI